jgi:hypothetical protein
MPSITDIRSSGTTLTIAQRPIEEPLAAPTPLGNHLRRFGDHYDISSNSNLYRFLLGLCGETGAGQIKKGMLYPKLQQLLESTHFTDLDRLYGDPLSLPRLNSEIYTVDPRKEALTQTQWQDVAIKDSQYRARCLIWMRAIIAGPTLEGIALAAEAATGVECTVFERYVYLDNQVSDVPIGIQNIGLTNSRQEFVIRPMTLSITEQDKRRISRLVDKLRPTDTIPTVQVGNRVRTQRTVRAVAATSERFILKRLVTGRSDIDWPTINLTEGEWVSVSETEAPTFAFMDTQESITYLSINNVTASSEHIGNFNPIQRQLFPHLDHDYDIYMVFDSANSFVPTIAPISISIPWTART